MIFFMNNTPKTTFITLVVQALFIALIAMATMRVTSIFYAHLDPSAQIDWSPTGRWVTLIAHGQFYTPNINQELPVAHEGLIGFATHAIISFTFACLYLTLLKHVFKASATMRNGWLFGLASMVMPFFIQHPLMGTGILALKTTHPCWTILSTVIYHSAFGLGLGLGSRCYKKMFHRGL